MAVTRVCMPGTLCRFAFWRTLAFVFSVSRRMPRGLLTNKAQRPTIQAHQDARKLPTYWLSLPALSWAGWRVSVAHALARRTRRRLPPSKEAGALLVNLGARQHARQWRIYRIPRAAQYAAVVCCVLVNVLRQLQSQGITCTSWGIMQHYLRPTQTYI